MEIVLQITIARQDGHGTDGSAAEVGVQDNAGGVDHWPERIAIQSLERLFDTCLNGRPGGLAGVETLAGGFEGAPYLGEHQGPGIAGQGRGEALEHLMDGGEGPQEV